jgi:7-cyano-7-deazaguanine tRNA-ribosyltransferase
MLSRLHLGKNVLVAFDGRMHDKFNDTLFFKPPFGPYPKELKETFPIGPCEIPEWDDTMVRKGCRGIKMLMVSHPDSQFVISCNPCWETIVRQELGDIEVRNDQV